MGSEHCSNSIPSQCPAPSLLPFPAAIGKPRFSLNSTQHCHSFLSDCLAFSLNSSSSRRFSLPPSDSESLPLLPSLSLLLLLLLDDESESLLLLLLLLLELLERFFFCFLSRFLCPLLSAAGAGAASPPSLHCGDH